MRLFASLVLGCVFFSSVGFTTTKSLEEHWKTVGFKMIVLQGFITTEKCYVDERQFMGCVVSINAMMNYAKKDLELRPAAMVEKQKVELGFGAIKLVESSMPNLDTKMERYQYYRRDRAEFAAGLAKLYRETKSKPIKFEHILSWLKYQPFFKQREAFIAAQGVNALYSVIYDPHTIIVPRSLAEEESDVTATNLVGIGVNLGRKKVGDHSYVVVESPIEGSPAHEVGIYAGDLIVSVNGSEAVDQPFDSVINHLNGEEGQSVELQVQRGTQKLTFSLIRRTVERPNVQTKLIKNGGVAVGYIRLGTFMYSNACEEMQKAVAILTAAKAQALVLDLRDNGGGRLDEGVCIANIFLDKGKVVVSSKSLTKNEEEVLSTTDEAMTDLPLVTLVDAGSASASEILAGALQDHGRSLIVGQRTYGKATVQEQRLMGNLPMVMRRTVSRFYLPSGRTNQLEGIVPDFEAYSNPNPSEEDKLALREEDLYMALPSQGKPWKQPRPEYIEKLSTCLSQNGVSEKRYQESLGSALPPDYALLYGQDVAACALSVGGS